MSLENAITAVICLAAAAYVGNMLRTSVRKAFGPSTGGCGGGCSKPGCSTSEGHAQTSELVTLKRKRSV